MIRLDPKSGNVTFDESKPTQVTEVPNTSGTGDLLLNLKTSDLTAWKSRMTGGKIDPYVTYADLGAVGDGTTDDSNAIIAAHYAANYLNIPVRPAPGGPYKYLLGKPDRIVTIRTDTDFGTHEIIIDDRKIDTVTKQAPNNAWPAYQLPVFEVTTPSNLVATIVLSAPARKGAAKIAMATVPKLAAGTWLVLAVDDALTNRRFMREGVLANGSKQTDVFLVDQDGNVQNFAPAGINAKAPILWNFSANTSYKAHYADPQSLPPLRICGGKFTTIANLVAGQDDKYMMRNLNINRSNVTVEGLTHLVQYLDATSAPIAAPANCPYFGFLWASECSNLNVVGCCFTGLRVRKDVNGKWLGNGSYDICLQSVVGARLVGCTQTQSNFADVGCWGVMKSDYCKNVTYENCTLTRFDAHRGIYNATIKGGEIGHMGVRVVGWGELRIENCIINLNELRCIVQLRNDYGSFWNGNITINNCTLKFPDNYRNSWAIIHTGLSSIAQAASYGYDFPLAINGSINVAGLTMKNPTGVPVVFPPIRGALWPRPGLAGCDLTQPNPYPTGMVSPTPKVESPLLWDAYDPNLNPASRAPGIFFDIVQKLDGKPSDFVKNYLAPLASGKVSVT